MKRFQSEQILADLAVKIVILVGPRQVGKTWLAKSLMAKYQNPLYLNYDRLQDREIMMAESWLPETDLLILDELHKKKGWKNYLKGLFDTRPPHLHILVTGSARLDTFAQSGDALTGRYFTHHLMPFSPAELAKVGENDQLDRLIEQGGFPEPFLAQTDQHANRWRLEYVNGLIRQDILNFESILELNAISQLIELLKTRIGSLISYQSLSEDLDISPNTVKKYLAILESLYIIFRVSPYAKNVARSLKKGSKYYFFDNGLIENDPGKKFENFLANILIKHCGYLQDVMGQSTDLYYLRTKDGKEIDFCICQNNSVIQMIEAKVSDDTVPNSLLYFSNKYGYPATQVVWHLKRERQVGPISIVSAKRFAETLAL